MAWYAVRQLFHFGVTSAGSNVFEERIVCFEAATEDEAYEKAEREADEYAEFHGFIAHSRMDAYLQDDEPLIEAYEVWSELYVSPLSLDDFYAARYELVAYRPQETRPPRAPRDIG